MELIRVVHLFRDQSPALIVTLLKTTLGTPLKLFRDAARALLFAAQTAPWVSKNNHPNANFRSGTQHYIYTTNTIWT
jgi:hypothetical protein